jgi:hypothetical protein
MAMTQSEYAAHRGVSRQAVNKLVKGNKIPVGKDGRIDPAEADFALGENRARINEPKAAENAESSSSDGLTRARTAVEIYKAKQAQLAYEQKLGRVLPLDGVANAASACGESVVRIIGSLSMRAEEIAAASSTHGVAGVRAALKAIERELRERLAGAFSKMVADATTVGTEAQAEGAPADDVEGDDE